MLPWRGWRGDIQTWPGYSSAGCRVWCGQMTSWGTLCSGTRLERNWAHGSCIAIKLPCHQAEHDKECNLIKAVQTASTQLAKYTKQTRKNVCELNETSLPLLNEEDLDLTRQELWRSDEDSFEDIALVTRTDVLICTLYFISEIFLGIS